MTALRVLEMFDSLQGEGVWAGVPMTFIRLAGCNAPLLGLGCLEWCDTPESWDPAAGESLAPAEIDARVRLPRACLTGGEPLLQGEGVAALLARLQARGIAAHVETNGTRPFPPGTAFEWVTVSPKPPDYAVVPELAGSIDELKVIVHGPEAPGLAVLERLAERHPEAVFCVQPEAGNEEARRLAVGAVMAHPRWRLSLQIHKLLGIR